MTVRRAVGLAAALSLVAFAGTAWGDGSRVSTTVLDIPEGFHVAEPHLAVAPDDPDRLYAVANVTGEELGLGLVWRTGDAGRTWKRSPLIGGTGATPRGFDADAVLAAGRKGLLLYTSLALDIDEVAETAPIHVGTRVSTDRGATFSAYGSADMVTLPLCLFFGCPPPPDLQGLDTPWLAVDTTTGRFRGSSYLVWVHDRADGRHELRFAASRDGGRTYTAPLVLDRTTAEQLDGLEELPHLVVRPDGRVDVAWNAARSRRPCDPPRDLDERRLELRRTRASGQAQSDREPPGDLDDIRRLPRRPARPLLGAGRLAGHRHRPRELQDDPARRALGRRAPDPAREP